MSYWHKIHRIASKAREIGSESVRELAEATGFSKSSVHRHLKAQRRRNQYPESPLWETPEGQAWLSRLVVATLLHFGLKRGVGLESISAFFEQVRIDTHVGISPTALRGVQQRLEASIVEYGAIHQTQGAQSCGPKEIVGGVDETFLDQMVLVMLDLPSGYLLLEEFSSDRTTQTWRERVDRALQPLSAHVRYLVSDRAKPLINLAVMHIGCRSVGDLFHATHEMAKGFSFPIHNRLNQAQKKLHEARAALQHIPQAQTDRWQQHNAHMQQLEQTVQQWQSVQEQYSQLLHQFSHTVHPFAVADSTPQTSAGVAEQLQETVAQLATLAQTHDLPQAEEKLKPVKNQLGDLAGLMDVWWDWVEHSLAEQASDFLMQHWLKEILLPKVYWERQVMHCRARRHRPIYQQALAQAQTRFNQHPLTPHFEAHGLAPWLQWAETMVSRFQRTSSPVEGRNGYLSHINHARRGLSSNRLKVLTVLHNFELKRADGTTAAERFFGTSFPDLSFLGKSQSPISRRKNG